MKTDVCKKIVQLDDNFLQATLLDKSNVVDSYMRQDSPLEIKPPEKDEGFTGSLFAHIAKRNEDRFGALVYQVIRYENAEIILVPVSSDFTPRLCKARPLPAMSSEG